MAIVRHSQMERNGGGSGMGNGAARMCCKKSVWETYIATPKLYPKSDELVFDLLRVTVL